MSIRTLEFHHVSFHYPEQVQQLFSHINISIAPGWTALIGANGTGKSTLLMLASGLLKPLEGVILRPEEALYLSQRTDSPPPEYDAFAYSWDHLACKLHGQLNLTRDELHRWSSLSHGERKRAQIGWAMYQQSDVLCVDEPTNHLDQDGIACLKHHLAKYRGIGLLVSHDLDLLDALCSKTVLVHAPYITMFSCSPSQALDTVNQQIKGLQSTYNAQLAQQKRLQSEVRKREAFAAVQDTRNSKRHIDRKDHDAKGRINGVRVSGADGKAGKLARQMERRVEIEQQKTESIASHLATHRLFDIKSKVDGCTIENGNLRTRTLLRSEVETLSLGPDRTLSLPPLKLGNSEKIGIRGPNGSGKTTLLRHLISSLSTTDVAYFALDQDMDQIRSLRAFESFHMLDEANKGRVVSCFVRLGSDPSLLLGSALPSPGELRKLLIAQSLEQNLDAIFLDEPTNHLDLPSRMALSDALASFSGSLFCISHDQHFLKSVCSTTWDITWIDESGNSQLLVG